jgi:hypothetical protein
MSASTSVDITGVSKPPFPSCSVHELWPSAIAGEATAIDASGARTRAIPEARRAAREKERFMSLSSQNLVTSQSKMVMTLSLGLSPTSGVIINAIRAIR